MRPAGGCAVALPPDLSSNVVKLQKLRRQSRILTTTGVVIALVVVSMLLIAILAEVLR